MRKLEKIPKYIGFGHGTIITKKLIMSQIYFGQEADDLYIVSAKQEEQPEVKGNQDDRKKGKQKKLLEYAYLDFQFDTSL